MIFERHSSSIDQQGVLTDDQLREETRVNDGCELMHVVEQIEPQSRLRFHQIVMEMTGGAAYGD